MPSKRTRIPGYGYLTIRSFNKKIEDEITFTLILDEEHCSLYNPGETGYYGVFHEGELDADTVSSEDIVSPYPYLEVQEETDYAQFRIQDAQREAEEGMVSDRRLPIGLRIVFGMLDERMDALLGCHYLWASRDQVVIEVKSSDPIRDPVGFTYTVAGKMKTLLREVYPTLPFSEEGDLCSTEKAPMLMTLNVPDESTSIDDKACRVYQVAEEVMLKAGELVFSQDEEAILSRLIGITEEGSHGNEREIKDLTDLLWKKLGRDVSTGDILLAIARDARGIKGQVVTSEMRIEHLRSAVLRAVVETSGYIVQERRLVSHLRGSELQSYEGRISNAHVLLEEALCLLDW